MYGLIKNTELTTVTFPINDKNYDLVKVENCNLLNGLDLSRVNVKYKDLYLRHNPDLKHIILPDFWSRFNKFRFMFKYTFFRYLDKI